MSMQTGKKTTHEIKFSSGKIIPRGAPVAILALMFSGLLLTAALASSVINPEPEDSTTRFGQSVAVIGDINGDGVPDLAVGTPFQDGDFDPGNGFVPPQEVGKVWLISGANLGTISQLNDPFFQVPRSFPKFGSFTGFSVAAAGDINGDGVPDVLVGVPHHSNFDLDHINAGEAFVFSGADESVLFTLTHPNEDEGDRMGYSVAGLGDVNGDGVRDLLVGIPKKDSEDGLLKDIGQALIFSGANGSIIRTLNPPAQGGAEANGRFGTAVADAGDVNHDGKDDILIGAPGNSKAYVFNGATGALIFTITNPSAPNAERLPSFGAAVAGGLDLDGDGTPDFVIGAPLQNKLQGAAFIFKGSNGTLLRSLRGSRQAFGKFGASVAVSSDVTGDDRAD